MKIPVQPPFWIIACLILALLTAYFLMACTPFDPANSPYETVQE